MAKHAMLKLARIFDSVLTVLGLAFAKVMSWSQVGGAAPNVLLPPSLNVPVVDGRLAARFDGVVF